MTYLAQSQLEGDPDFQRRVRAVNTQQASTYIDDAAADIEACAEAILRDAPGPQQALLRMAAAGPGIADKVDLGNATVDQSLVTDEDLLALTQANWPVVAALYYDTDGTPKP